MRTTIGRSLAIVASAALLASLTVAAPASAAKPKCAGRTATIVGTKKSEVIRGTRRADVIVARGGHDRIYGRGGNDVICGGSGNDLIVGGAGIDRLYGALGRDRLLGGPGPDRLDGGTGVDACYQGPGNGPRVRCELPRPPTLVIAYSDINHNQVYDAGDVLISKVVDTNADGVISQGDTIKMGKYPTYPAAVILAGVRETFEDWRVKSYTVGGVTNPGPDSVYLRDTNEGTHSWWTPRAFGTDQYSELFTTQNSVITDNVAAGETDSVHTEVDSPSQPKSNLDQRGVGKGDDSFIDVIIYP